MKLCDICTANKKHKGFVLTELLVALAILSAIGGILTTTIIQLNDTSLRNRSYLGSVNGVHNAGYWIHMDAQMSQIVEVAPGDTGLPVSLSWTEWDSTKHNVIYNVVNGELLRNHSVNSVVSGTMTVTPSVITGSPATTCQFVDTDDPPDGDGDILVFTVTATEGSGRYQNSETRVFEFEPRLK